MRRLNEKEKCDDCYRLPTEAEWEYACLAGSRQKYGHGNSEITLPNYAWYGEGKTGQTHVVGTKLPNNWGLFDMSGNVWEWTSDFYDSKYYDEGNNTDPKGPAYGAFRVLRGGSSWYNAFYSRCAYR